jgi:hypothetical protein
MKKIASIIISIVLLLNAASYSFTQTADEVVPTQTALQYVSDNIEGFFERVANTDRGTTAGVLGGISAAIGGCTALACVLLMIAEGASKRSVAMLIGGIGAFAGGFVIIFLQPGELGKGDVPVKLPCDYVKEEVDKKICFAHTSPVFFKVFTAQELEKAFKADSKFKVYFSNVYKVLKYEKQYSIKPIEKLIRAADIHKDSLSLENTSLGDSSIMPDFFAKALSMYKKYEINKSLTKLGDKDIKISLERLVKKLNI